MCGIVGYIGKDNALEVVIEGLKKLEYRGYDSAGVAYQKNNEIQICKEKGRVLDLKKCIMDSNSSLAIGHTRWATHGEPNQRNAHPHSSMSGRFIVVHNGIIENYQKLKFEYLDGYRFISDTDTEIIADLIEYFSNTLSVDEAIRKTMSLIEGSYACLILDVEHQEHIYCMKDKSPLLIGTGKEGVVFSSDITGLVGYANEYMALEDKTFGIATIEDVCLYDLIGIPKNKSFQRIAIQKEEIDKQTYDHFMLKEIHEQPMMIRNLIQHYFNKDEVNISPKLIHQIRQSDKINFVACGSSMYASYFAKYYMEKLCGIPCEVFCASELVYSTPLISKRPFFIFFSQSGETADLLAVMKKIKKQKHPILTITNTIESSMVRLSDFYLNIYAGKEIAVASTKAYTAMVVTSAILARAVSKTKTNLKNNLKAVSLAMEKVLENKEVCKGIAKSIIDKQDLFYLGRGIDYWTSLEASLKLKEIAYIHTEGFSSGELKHGPIALITKNTPVIAIITQEGTNRIIRSNLAETASRGAKTYVISSKSLSTPNDDVIIPNVAHYLSPLVSVLVVQLIAYYAAVLKHSDVDKPKNLAKSVTVE
ncbi:MAG: glutamine--fructose-6-phosphate transaminase (isomerizing) [Roseburia sp.]|nr:glutamine--fructose-6-phosphate transaminase (isomerizing) [Anaeroplasma bactoclasticum]MCM1196286.1 glutamine--fructose-6-phosphate transaminase (isomerizing) [Roseburia sp.]MCM1557463.1 glutamine--fructose-6-phosphate transaminase (isomerizing) [Anaeroplasma bactoclasticum]